MPDRSSFSYGTGFRSLTQRQCLGLRGRDGRLHRDADADALLARHAGDTRRFRLRRGARRPDLDSAPAYHAKRACHYNYITAFGMESLYRICRIGDDGARQQIAEIAAERPSYMHSFGMSEDYLILTAFPLVVNPIDLRLWGKPRARMTASCCPSWSTSPRIARSCLCSMLARSPNWRGRRPLTPSPSISTGAFFQPRLDLGRLVADIPARIQGRSVTEPPPCT